MRRSLAPHHTPERHLLAGPPDREHEQVGADEQHHEPLDDEREVAGKLRVEHARIELAARGAGVERREEQGCEEHAHRAVAAEERNCDPEEGDLRDDLDVGVRPYDVELPAEHVDAARKAGKGARDRHREQVVPLDADPAVAGRLGVEPDRPDLEAERRAVEDRPEDDQRTDRDEEPDVEPLQDGVAPEDGEVDVGDDVLRGRAVGGADERPLQAEEVRPGPDRDPVEHDRRDHLVGARRRLQEPCDPTPDRAHGDRKDEAEQDVRRTRDPRPRRADDHRGEGADEVLALAADVEHPASERERDGEPAEDERSHDDEGLLEVRGLGRAVAVPGDEPGEARPVEDRAIGVDRVVPGREHDEAADEERERRRDDRDDEPLRVEPLLALADRRGDRRRPRLAGCRGKGRLRHDVTAGSWVTPVIARPSVFSGTSGENSPTISPSNITRIRSARA